ncbi:MAG: hypothetical protein WB611_24665 [Stellaceae bacterium]
MMHLKNAIKIASVIVGLTAPMTSVFADQGNLSPAQLPELTAAWWEWALSIPNSANPVLDGSGDYCMVGQRDPIWFLAGSFSGTPVTRTCSIPETVSLFFPVINNVQFDSPNVCGQGPESIPVKQLRKNVAAVIDDAYAISVQVDGFYISKTSVQRLQSPVFWTALQADNFFGGSPSCPAGIYSPTVSDGYWVALNPLKRGPHTIHFHAESQGFAQDLTYNLTVVPVSQK